MTGAAGRRVVITGLGVVSSIGVGAVEFGAALRAGRSGVRPVTAFDTTGFEHAVAGEIVGFDPAPWIERLAPAELGRAGGLAVAAARMAVADAGPLLDGLRARHSLVAVGTTNAESRDFDQLVAQTVAHGPVGIAPEPARRTNAGRLSTLIARELGLTDVEALTIPTACAAGNYAIGYGFDAVRAGDTDVALCGGADALCRKTFAGFYRMGAMAPERCQPFDANRKGMLTGEGAGMLVLESLDHALARGARIYAEVLGFGLNCDADNPVAPNADSVARCMRLALDCAGIKPDEVDLISAHGTATRANDLAEARAIHQVYGDRPPRTVAMKSMLGHTLGAASALAAIGCILAIVGGFIPPTINHEETDPDCAVDCVPNTAVAADLRVVQNNALAFGGNNAVLILGRYRDEP
ncbi:MAG TPA: beta-ketoacyl-[acyl-carrier-protein] synthase family protein [Actinophytocola sp.]|uniref:beta-ketoacyl-[acyl-carrier-protein] synthase family protein n=1 Tax=Actinophytocola sp. TaxID=1872138 RepID=UPI002DBF9387|nr:beta-ketoacyl-[acyl-carrier-protein] synthase family protein [Actinophytocola sp.]HEU5470223.1 beta-ketoacyl-[acyl-carrier-protein] synthase family protein [Actinophytocola sp.]